MENMKVNEAQRIAAEIRNKYAKPFESTKWTDIYNSEDEIIADLKIIHIPGKNEQIFSFAPLYAGYEYIHSFAKQVQSGKELTEKQMKQCKRLALEIKKMV